jgi:hypothetical protein
MDVKGVKWACVFLFGALFFDLSFAQTATVTPEEELAKKIRAANDIAPVGSTPFGEEVSTYDGSLSFRQTDIDQPGLGLPIQLVRTHRTDDAWRFSAFADWKLEIPHIETLAANASGTENDASDWFFLSDVNRCSNFRQAPTIVLPTGNSPVPVFYLPGHWWNGYQLVIPGLGSQDLLLRDSSNTASPQMPSDGGGLHNFHIVTKQNWMVSCLANTSNDKPGEGFLVVSPEGVKYWMDWLVHKKYQKVGFAQPGFGGVARRTAMMMVSRVEDRFGNSLLYSYDASGDLASVQASDGRRLVLTYEPSQSYGMNLTRVRTATLYASDAPSRMWTYTYTAAANAVQHLTGVVQPDGKAWSFNLKGLHYSLGAAPIIEYDPYDGCSYAINSDSSLMQGQVVHPSGLVGEFTLKLAMRGRSYVPFKCTSLSGSHSLDIANAYTVAAVNQKRISGPGLTPKIWSYSYSPANQSWAKDCGSGCAASVWTDVTDPAGATVRHTFSNRFDVSEGRILRKDFFSGLSGSTIVRSEEYTYAAATAGPWPGRMGVSRQPHVNNDQIEQVTPVVRNVVTQQGGTFVRAVEEFDGFARALRVVRFSSFGHTRTDATSYYDNLTKWVLSQVRTASNSNNGLIVSQVDYDAVTALPLRTYAFGKLQQGFTYYTDGTLATVKDGNNNVTSLSGWKRGIPQSIRYADGAVQTAVVNDNGWIRSVTDETKSKTCYGYDVMGRLASITYPSASADEVCDGSGSLPTTFSFERRDLVEHGLPAGHWLRREVTGNYRKNTFFDALWRPVLVHEYDGANTAGTLRTTGFTYDANGRVNFASYPVNTALMGTTGIRTTYDALDRVKTVSQDSELVPLTTTTEYLAGFKTRVTNPRGTQTITEYQVFDQPTTEAPTLITVTGGTVTGGTVTAITEIERDPFGKPRRITRRNADGSQRLDRRFVYDNYQQLCKTLEPETGATVMDYDLAGNLQWSAAGLALPSTTSCDTVAARDSGRRTIRHYDARNRLLALYFPDSNGNQRWAYWPDGLVKQITTANAGVTSYNSYAYNKRRLLTGESLGHADGEAWALGYGYNPNGHLAGIRYPSGQTVALALNALGQATQVGSYATGVSYYPNGAIKQFTYGNGIVHTMTQNDRQLPDTSKDAYGATAFLQDGYDYDHNGNVAAITDGATGRNQRGNRTMTYDGLDRLTQTVSPMFGTARYGYDVLDNLTRTVAAGRDQYYCYDTNWRLTNLKLGSCSGSTVVGLGYDEQGNLANKNGQGFKFDYGNRLREATGKESYRYDGHGRRTHATHSTGTIRSMYDQAGVLRYQKNARETTATDYIQLGGSLVAEAEWPIGQMPPTKDYVNWSGVTGTVRYVVEESVDGATWASVYEGTDLSWTSLARPLGTYSYRVLACNAAGVCTAVGNVSHDQRPAFNIVPMLYQILLS